MYYEAQCIDPGSFKLVLILYTDDMHIMTATAEEIQNNLNVLFHYGARWKSE